MAWADEARCLHCNGKLPLFRKLRNGQFCSAQHEKEYWAEQERLAVEVLHRTHDVLMAYKPLDDVELIIGPAVDWHGTATPEPPRVQAPQVSAAQNIPPAELSSPEPDSRESARPEPAISEAIPAEIAGFLQSVQPEQCAPIWGGSPAMFVEDPSPYEVLQVDLGALASSIAETHVTVGEADAVAVPLGIAATRPAASIAILESAEPLLEVNSSVLLMGSDLQPRTIQPAPDPPAAGLAALRVDITPANPLPPIAGIPEAVLRDGTQEAVAFCLELKPEPWPEPLIEEVPEQEPDEPAPPMAGWQPMSMWAAPLAARSTIANAVEPILAIPRMMKLVMADVSAFRFSLDAAPLQRMGAVAAQTPSEAEAQDLQWVRLWSIRVPALPERSIGKLSASVRLAGGCRYVTRTNARPVMFERPQGPVEFSTKPHAPEYPALTHFDLRHALNMEFAPDVADLITLRGRLREIRSHAPAKARIRHVESELEQLGGHACIPAWGHQPLRWETKSAGPAAETPETTNPGAPLPYAPPQQTEPPPFLHAVAGFWRNAPRDLRLLIFAIPALLALAFHPSLPKVHVSTVQATEPMQTKVGDAVNGSWNNFKLAVSSRAAVALDEDFRSGLDEWQSPGGVATEWSFDANGFVRPGSLALYSPSLNLTDYQAQFLALIDKKALSWVVRAADFENYYVVKLVVLKPGPLTTLGMTRYAVIKGKAQDRVDAVVPLTARPDMIYRVRVDVHDDSFAVTIQGQMIDAWSEPKLKRGGIGFFSARGEASRVRWLQVTHQYDMLGRLCSYLAPYDLAATNGLWETTTNNQNGSWKP